MHRTMMGLAIALMFVLSAGVVIAQQAKITAPDTLPDGPRVFDSSRRGPSGRPIPGPQFRVVPVKGLSHPYALAFLPDGNMLITERAGRIRIARNGVLDATPIAGLPAISNRNLQGLNDIALHPRFAENQWVYFTYYREKPGDKDAAAAVLARGRFDGKTMTEIRDIFVTDTMVAGASAARFVFGRDGKIYLAIGVPLPTTVVRAWRRCQMPRIRPAISARSSVSMTMGVSPPIILSWGAPDTNPNCMRLAFGTRWGSLFTR